LSSTSIEQLLVLSEYIKSYDILKKIQNQINIKSLYSNLDADNLSRLENDISNKEFLDYYRKMIEVKIDRESAIIDLRAKAFDPQDAFLIASTIRILSEDFLNAMLERVKMNSLIDAEEFVSKAENKVKTNQIKLSNFMIENTTLSPTQEIEAKIELIRAFETKKAEFLLERNEKKSLFSGSSITMKSLKDKIKNIDEIIADTKNGVLKYQGEEGDSIREFEMIRLDTEFATEEYKLAILNLGQTIKDNSEKNKYIVEIVKAGAPDIAVEPERLTKVLTVLFISFIASCVFCISFAGIRDHIVH
jgi:capsular polysaccharide transport system permease protein